MCAFVCLKLFFHAPSVNINTIRFEDSSLCYAYILSTKSNDVVLLLSLFYWIYSLRHFSCLSIMGFFRRIFFGMKSFKKTWNFIDFLHAIFTGTFFPFESCALAFQFARVFRYFFSSLLIAVIRFSFN